MPDYERAKFIFNTEKKHNNMNDLKNRIYGVFPGLGIDCSEINGNTDYYLDLNIDLLDFTKIIVALEKEFKIKIPDNDILGLETISDTLEYLEGRIIKC